MEIFYSILIPLLIAIGLGVSVVALQYLMNYLKAKLIGTSFEFLVEIAQVVVATYTNKYIPKIQDRIKTGELSSVTEVKEQLRNLGVMARDDLKAATANLPIKFSDHVLDKVIREAADAHNPFPGEPTAEGLWNASVDFDTTKRGDKPSDIHG